MEGRTLITIAAIVQVILIPLGIVGRYFGMKYIEEQTYSKKGSQVYDVWVSPTNNTVQPQKVYAKFTAFNVSNFAETQYGAKPILVEMGTYTYNVYKWKTNITFVDDDKVEYTYHTTYEFNRDLTPPNLDPNKDISCFPNVGLYAMTTLPWGFNYYSQPSTLNWTGVTTDYDCLVETLAQLIYTGCALPPPESQDGNFGNYICRTVQDSIFGYKDEYLYQIGQAAGILSNSIRFPNLPLVLEAVTNDDPFTYSASTGEYIDNGMLYKFAGYETLPVWGSKEANTLQGSDATRFGFNTIRAGEKQNVFVDLLFRNLGLVYKQNTTFEGLDVFEYGMDDTQFQNAVNNPDNAAYYHHYYDGYLNLSQSTVFQKPALVPLFFSKPYFLDADPKSILAQMPRAANKSTDQPVKLLVDPLSGQTVSARVKFQANAFWLGQGYDPAPFGGKGILPFNQSCVATCKAVQSADCGPTPSWVNLTTQTDIIGVAFPDQGMLPLFTVEMVIDASQSAVDLLKTLHLIWAIASRLELILIGISLLIGFSIVLRVSLREQVTDDEDSRHSMMLKDSL